MYSFRPRVAHVDMDCFFVSCERLRRPGLRERALVVAWGASRLRASSRPRGVVLCASYEARPFGLRAGMSLAMAVRLCPAATYIEPSHEIYGEKSDAVFSLLRRFSPAVERASVDEFFLDLTGCRRALVGGEADGSAPLAVDWKADALERAGRMFREAVRREVGLPSSVGIARNRLLAKLGSDRSKPGGLKVIEPEAEAAFLEPLPVGALPGVGPKTQLLLERLGVRTVGELQKFPLSPLTRRMGRWGQSLVRSAWGDRDDPIAGGPARQSVAGGDRAAFHDRTDPDLPAQSASANTTLVEDCADPDRLRRILLGLVERVCPRLRGMRTRACAVTVRVRYSDFEEHTRAAPTAAPTDWEGDVYRAARGAFDELYVPGRPVRLVGVSLHRLVETGERDLFGRSERVASLERSIDRIHDRFGGRAIRFASSVAE
jgi:DNA polymerase-4